MHRRKSRLKSYFIFVLVVSGAVIFLSFARVGLKHQHVSEVIKTANDLKCVCTTIKSRDHLHVDRVNYINTTHVATQAPSNDLKHSRTPSVTHAQDVIFITSGDVRRFRLMNSTSSIIREKTKHFQTTINPFRYVRNNLYINKTNSKEENINSNVLVTFDKIGQLGKDGNRERSKMPYTNMTELQQINSTKMKEIITRERHSVNPAMNKTVHVKLKTDTNHLYMGNINNAKSQIMNRKNVLAILAKQSSVGKLWQAHNTSQETMNHPSLQNKNSRQIVHARLDNTVGKTQLLQQNQLDRSDRLQGTAHYDKNGLKGQLSAETNTNLKRNIGSFNDIENQKEFQLLLKTMYQIQQNRKYGDQYMNNAIINDNFQSPSARFKLDNTGSVVLVMSNITTTAGRNNIMNRRKTSSGLGNASHQKRSEIGSVVQEPVIKFETTAGAFRNTELDKSGLPTQTANDISGHGKSSYQNQRSPSAKITGKKYLKNDKLSYRVAELSSKSKNDTYLQNKRQNATNISIQRPKNIPTRNVWSNIRYSANILKNNPTTLNPQQDNINNMDKNIAVQNVWTGINYNANLLILKPTTVSPPQDNIDSMDENTPVRQDSCHMCFKNKIPILINPKYRCSVSLKIQILILIASGPLDKAKRDQIRRTWGSNLNRLKSSMKYVFVIGNFRNQFAGDPTSDFGSSYELYNSKLDIESKRHNDILQFDFVDSYANLTYKTLSGLKWAATYCNSAKYVMKTDTDMFVNTHLLPMLIQHAPRTHFIGGYCWGKSSPHRDTSSKWYVSYNQFRHDLFPEMCSGTGYILSGDIVRLILKRSRNIPYFYLEDVYISLCLKGTGLKPKRLMGFYNVDEPFEACHYKTEVITSHLIDPYMLQQYWDEVQSCKLTVVPESVYKEIPYPFLE